MRRSVTLLLVVLGTSCLGSYSSTPEELARFEWTADVKASPPSPVAGRALSLTLELASRSNVSVVVDVFLRAHRADGTLMHQQVWRGVRFAPEEVWSLTQGFLPSTTERGSAVVSVELFEAGTPRPLWRGGGPTLVFR